MWPKTFSIEKLFDRKQIRPKNFSTENFAVRIAEGGSNGGGPVGGGGSTPPDRRSRGFCGASITDPALQAAIRKGVPQGLKRCQQLQLRLAAGAPGFPTSASLH